MNEVEFLRPRLCGERFEDGGIPLEVLKDLSVLEEMLKKVAKWRFLQDHPERQRIPKGFEDSIELKLSDVEAGSAVPVITLSDASAHPFMFPSHNTRYLEQARNSIVNAIGAVNQGEPASGHLRRQELVYFNRIGRFLRDDEYIELIADEHSTPVRLTCETRHKLILESKEALPDRYVVLRGLIPEADQDGGTFVLELLDGGKVTVPILDQYIDTILEAFNGYQRKVRVLLRGMGKFNLQDHLVGVEPVEQVSRLDPLDIHGRLDELRCLEDGWLDGDGKAPGSDELDWLAAGFDRHYPEDLPLPYLYPTTEGGVQAEWSLSDCEISLEVNLLARRAAWHQLDLETPVDNMRELDLDSENDWAWIASEIRSMAKVGV
ncbi:MAG: hypothetical protein OXG98_01380 [Gemmatimonadetes bacterium]|nr:hypothetical protein [Gemmatimonadota bacterium]